MKLDIFDLHRVGFSVLSNLACRRDNVVDEVICDLHESL